MAVWMSARPGPAPGRGDRGVFSSLFLLEGVQLARGLLGGESERCDRQAVGGDETDPTSTLVLEGGDAHGVRRLEVWAKAGRRLHRS